jgi:D-alanyl-D-alanine carboxypeptidase/D-alanyl-D-alanine-endopeptidase (penicillin-binding protein 4)
MSSSGKAIVAALAAAVLLAPQPASATTRAGARTAETAMASRLAREMRAAGRFSGAHVVNLSDGRPVFRWRQHTPRTLASNTKLFTTAAALARFGTEGTLGTEVLGGGRLQSDGVWRGDLYLRGSGDPTFGSSRFARRTYGSRATVDELAGALDEAGVRRVSGRVVGDESRFDSLRGGPDSGYGTSIWVGPLSALAYNRGLADERGRSFQTDPPLFAAARLDDALERRGIRVRRAPATGWTAAGSEVLASVDSPPMERLVRITNKGSDNFFAEMLLKGLARQTSGRGTTAGGALIVSRFARRLGSRVRLVDGSGLSRANRASPAGVVRLLSAVERRDEFDALLESLPIAGSDGTLQDRMRSGPARHRCSAKTGTLSNVSALSGYCEARSGELYAFSILMNGVYPVAARRLQDRMAQAIAAIAG